MSRADDALAALEALAETRISDGLSRYGIATADRVIGVPMAGIQKVGKQFGRDHELAAALWAMPVYEAKLLVAYVAEPQRTRLCDLVRAVAVHSAQHAPAGSPCM